MFDTKVRQIIDPVLNKIGQSLSDKGVSANGVTWAGFGIGMIAAVSIGMGYFIVGLVLLLLSRLCDGLDGAVARATEKTDLGGFLDIVLDFAFYGAIPLAFIVADPQSNAVAGGFLLLVFYVNGASFLTYALMAEKRGLDADDRGSKSLLYTAGLAEGTETIVVFVIFCLLPGSFALIASVFAFMVLITTITRFLLAYRAFN